MSDFFCNISPAIFHREKLSFKLVLLLLLLMIITKKAAIQFPSLSTNKPATIEHYLLLPERS